MFLGRHIKRGPRRPELSRRARQMGLRGPNLGLGLVAPAPPRRLGRLHVHPRHGPVSAAGALRCDKLRGMSRPRNQSAVSGASSRSIRYSMARSRALFFASSSCSARIRGPAPATRSSRQSSARICPYRICKSSSSRSYCSILFVFLFRLNIRFARVSRRTGYIMFHQIIQRPDPHLVRVQLLLQLED